MTVLSARKRRVSKIVLLGLGVILVLGGVAVAVLSALNPDRLRLDLQEAVRRQTGRALTVAGGVHLRIGLSPQIVLEDVSLANSPGGSRPQMLTARRVRARLALLPLLGGDAVIASLVVEQPDLLLERGADGTPNWAFVPEHRAALYRDQGGGGGGAHRVEIRALSLEGGQASWQPAAGQPITIGIGRLKIAAEDIDSPMRLTFEGTENGVPLTIEASSGSLQRLQGGPVSAIAGAWPVSLDAAAQGATLHVEGGFTHPEQGRGYQLRLKFAAPSLASLNGLLGSPMLPPLAQVDGAALFSDGSQGELRTSQVALHAGASDLSLWVAGLSLRQAVLTAPGPGQLAQMTVDGTYQDQPLRAALTAMQPDVASTYGPVQVTLEAQAAGATLSAHGTTPPGLGASGLDLQVGFRAPDLSLLSPLAGRTLPAAHDVAADAQVGDAGVKLRGVAVRNLVASSSMGDVSGEATVVWAPRPSVSGTLTSRVLNFDGLAPGALDGVLPIVWPTPPTVTPPGPVPGATPPPEVPSATPPPAMLPLAQLRRADADLDLSVGDLLLAGGHTTDFKAHLRLQDGKLALNPFHAQTPDGPVVGGVSLDASSDQPPVAVTFRSPALAAGAVAASLGYPGGASGTAQVDAQLSGTGASPQAIAASLDGHLGLAMVGGQVVDSLVQGLLGTVLNTAGVPFLGGGSTQIRCLALRADFRRGEGNVRALSADTPRLDLDGDGRIDLAAGTAELHLRPRVRLGPTEVAAPVSLTGAFGQMRAALDPVMGGGRVGLTIGGGLAPSDCAEKLALARGGLTGPMPPQADTPVDPGLVIRKPKDLLKGLFH